MKTLLFLSLCLALAVLLSRPGSQRQTSTKASAQIAGDDKKGGKDGKGGKGEEDEEDVAGASQIPSTQEV